MNIMSARWGRLYRGTPSELSLEDAVAALGVPYRTQFPGYLYGFRYFPDFLLPTLDIVIEVDDRSHQRDVKREADEERTATLAQLGWRVLRCTNDEAMNDPHGTVHRLLAEAGLWPASSYSYRRLASCLPQRKKCPKKGNGKTGRATARQARQAALIERRRRPTSPPAGSRNNVQVR